MILNNFLRVCINIKIIILVLISLTVNILPQEDETQFTHITAGEGLSLSVVTQLLQDSRGFLWLGTYNGLNRYDGYNFKVFLPDSKDPNSISNHSISAMLEDSHGVIWIGTMDGLNRYDWRTESFRRYKNIPGNSYSLSSNNIYSIYEDKEGILWIGTLNGLNKYNREKDNFYVIKKVTDKLNPDTLLNSVTTITEDQKGFLWLGTWNGLSCMQKNGKVIKQFFIEPVGTKSLEYRKISTVFVDNENNLWVGTNGKGLKRYDEKIGDFIQYTYKEGDFSSLSHDYITAIFQDKAGSLWIGTKNGLNKYDKKKNNFIRYLNDPQKPLSLINNEIFSIIEDNTGIMWVGTSGGASKSYHPNNVFNYYSEMPGNSKTGLSSNRVNSIYIDEKDNLWVATFDGFDEIQKAGGQVIHHKNNQGNKNSLSNNITISVGGDKRGYIWVGTNDNGLNRYNPSTGEFKLYMDDMTNKYTISNKGVTSTFEDSKGNLWFGTWWGLNKFDRKTEKFTRFMANQGDSDCLRNDLIWIVYEDSQGFIWVGTDGGGVSRYNTEDNKFTNFWKDTTGSNTICSNRVLTLTESKDGNMWFGTPEGLSMLNRKSGKFKNFTTKDGLPGILTNGIIEDKNGYLWISTDKGISKYNRKNNVFTNYTLRNGLKELEFKNNVFAKSSDGTLYFGCKKGVMYFHPDNIKDEYLTAPIVFTDLKIYNQSVPISSDGSTVLKESVSAVKLIEIPYQYDVITIDFALLDYFDVKQNNFSYRLKGFDPDWNEVGRRNSATYTNLPPGEYTFLVKAFNSEGVKGIKEASIKLIIMPAYYQTLWFKFILISVIFFATIILVQERTKKIKKRNKILESRVAERTKDLDNTISELSQEITERKKAEEKVQASLEEKEVLLKEVHHRVKNNLQVISSLLYLQSFSIKDEETLNLFNDSQNRIKSMALIHEKLYQSKNFSEINFSEYVKSLLEHLNRSFKKNGVLISIYTKIEDIKLSLDTAISCGLIINELITNAYKYAFPPELISTRTDEDDFKIEVNIEKAENNQYILLVRDNGVGIPDNIDIQNSDSLGLKLVNSMVNQLSGSIEISKNNGTLFKIKFSDEK